MQELTPRQLEAANLAADGYTIDEIGSMLDISPRTAKSLLRVARQKLGVDHKRELGRALRRVEA